MNKYAYSNKAKTEIGHPSHNGGHAARILFAGRKTAKAALDVAQSIHADSMTRSEYQRAVRIAVSKFEPIRGGVNMQEPGWVSE